MTQHKSKRIIKKFHDLSPAARQALAEHLVDRKITDITLAEAHGVVEINVQYIHKGRVSGSLIYRLLCNNPIPAIPAQCFRKTVPFL